jgi:hypothetical protein
MIEDFFHLPTLSTTPMVHLELRISPQILKKLEMALMVYSGAWEKLIHEKKPEVENLVTLSLLGPREMKNFFAVLEYVFPDHRNVSRWAAQPM